MQAIDVRKNAKPRERKAKRLQNKYNKIIIVCYLMLTNCFPNNLHITLNSLFPSISSMFHRGTMVSGRNGGGGERLCRFIVEQEDKAGAFFEQKYSCVCHIKTLLDITTEIKLPVSSFNCFVLIRQGRSQEVLRKGGGVILAGSS